MARIKNIELPGEKHTCIGLTAIYGIGCLLYTSPSPRDRG